MKYGQNSPCYQRKKDVTELLFETLPARYCESRDKIHVVIVSPEEGCSSLWDENVFFEVTGQILTKHIIDTCYIEVDTIDFFEIKKFEIKLIPEIFFV